MARDGASALGTTDLLMQAVQMRNYPFLSSEILVHDHQPIIAAVTSSTRKANGTKVRGSAKGCRNTLPGQMLDRIVLSSAQR